VRIDHGVAEQLLTSFSYVHCHEFGIQRRSRKGLHLLLLVIRQKKCFGLNSVGLRESRLDGFVLGVKDFGRQVAG
jgi:hypothetical protein